MAYATGRIDGIDQMKPGEVDKPNADVVGRIPSEACDSREQTGTQHESAFLFH